MLCLVLWYSVPPWGCIESPTSKRVLTRGSCSILNFPDFRTMSGANLLYAIKSLVLFYNNKWKGFNLWSTYMHLHTSTHKIDTTQHKCHEKCYYWCYRGGGGSAIEESVPHRKPCGYGWPSQATGRQCTAFIWPFFMTSAYLTFSMYYILNNCFPWALWYRLVVLAVLKLRQEYHKPKVCLVYEWTQGEHGQPIETL